MCQLSVTETRSLDTFCAYHKVFGAVWVDFDNCIFFPSGNALLCDELVGPWCCQVVGRHVLTGGLHGKTRDSLWQMCTCSDVGLSLVFVLVFRSCSRSRQNSI